MGPPTNTFGDTADPIADARSARDTYAGANADWLAQYNGNGALMIRLLHTGMPAATFEVRAAGAWVDVTAAITGPPGPQGNPGPGVDDAHIQSLIDATDLSDLQGTVSDTQIPASIFRDAEFTADLVRTRLGLTQLETDELITGSITISGDAITFTRNDGTTVTVSLSSFLSESEFSAQRGGRLYLGEPAVYDDSANTITITLSPAIAPAIRDHVLFITPSDIGAHTDALSIVEDVPGGLTLPLHNDDGDMIAADHLVAGRVYTIVRLFGSYRVLEPLEERPILQTTLAVGWSVDRTAEASELTATAMAHEVTIPDHSGIDYVLLWTADSQGTLSAVYLSGSNLNSLNTYGTPTALELNGVQGTVRATINQRVGSLVSGLAVRVEFS